MALRLASSIRGRLCPGSTMITPFQRLTQILLSCTAILLGATVAMRAQGVRKVLLSSTSVPRSFSPMEIAQNFRNGRVLAKAKAGADPAALRSVEGLAGTHVERTFRKLPGLEVLQFDQARPIKAQIAKLMASGLYDFVEPDRIIRASLVPNDADFPDQWNMNNTGQNGGTPGADIKAEAGWAIQTGAPSTIVAVIDSGIRLTHEDLAANIWKNPNPGSDGYVGDVNGINATFPQTEPGNGNPNDDFFHGTMVAGIIGAVGNNTTGVAGVAWSVQLMPLKFIAADGFGSGSGEIACIDYAISHNARIINGSFGSDQPSSAEYYALDQAREAGIIVVVAAGNDGVNADAGYAFPAGYLLDNIVTVAATTDTDTLSSYSNFGSGTVDLAAPGDNIPTTFNSSDSAYVTGSGTSFAAPHVAGALALLQAHFPADSYRQLINRLLSGVDPIAGLSGVVQTGGRLDLAAALGSTSNAPFNDNFARRAVLSGSVIQVRSSNVGATLEAGEPATLAGVPIGASLWWTWTPTQSGVYYFDTTGSTFDTVIGIFTGSSVSSLSPVASNDDGTPGGGISQLSFSATAGTTYQIEVAGKNGVSGIAALRIASPPANDAFASAQVVAGNPANGSFSVLGTTLYATTEGGEPSPTGAGGGHTVWYAWTAPVSGQYELAAFSSTLDMVSAVYTGTSVAGLTLVGANNNEASNDEDSLVPFTATAGQTYYFQVDNTDASGGNFTVLVNNAAWQFATGAGITSSPAVGADGTIYLSSTDGFLYALNPDGSPKWSYMAGGYFDNVSPALEANGTVVDGASDGNLYCLNASTGALAWKFQASSAISTSPAIGSDGSVYFHDDLNLYGVTSGGTLKWRTTINGHSYSSPVIGTNGTLYVGTPTGLVLYDANGNMLTSLATSAPVDASCAIDADGTVYVGTVGGDAYALNPDGSQKWHSTFETGEQFNSSPVIAPDGSVCMAGGSGSLYELSPADGSTLVNVTLPSSVTLAAPVVAADGTIYVGTNDFNLYAVAPGTNQVNLVASTAYYIFGSPMLANGYLYFGSLDAKLYAFNVGEFPAPTPWPMNRQGVSMSGRAVGGLAVTGITPSKTVVSGYPLSLNVSVSGGPASGPYQPVSFQWLKDGVPIAGATSPGYQVAAVSGTDAGTYSVTVTGPAGAMSSPPTSVLVDAPDPGRLINLSARSLVENGDAILIAGFVISGSGTKNVLVRGIGPTLGSFGVSGFLSNPVLNVDNSSGTIFTDTGWGGGSALAATFSQVGAFGLPANSADSALVDPFPAGAYTALVSGANGTGVALAEIYDADIGVPTSRLKNLSVRAQVGTGSGILIAGFVISGNLPKTVLIRGIGPALTGFGVAGVLENPVLGIYNNSGSLIQDNYQWGGEPRLASAMSAAGAFSLSPSSADTALLITLPPGAYTAQESGANSTSGVGLIEVYEVQ
jgi:outer membrane protein assembly factor BamB